jgi:hypothetical protein
MRLQVDTPLDAHDPCYDPIEDASDSIVVTYVEDPFPPLGSPKDEIGFVEENRFRAPSL